MWQRHFHFGLVLAACFMLAATRSVEKRALKPDASATLHEVERRERPRSPREIGEVAIPTNYTEGCSGPCQLITAKVELGIHVQSPSNDTLPEPSGASSANKDDSHFGNIVSDVLRPPARIRRNTFPIFGEDANPGEFPWQARINFNGRKCGGVLVHGCYVLTAKHCAQDPVSDYTVTLGDHSKFFNDGTEQVRQVLKIFLHATYDAALLLLKTGTNTSSPYVQPIPVLASSLPAVGSTVVVTGWELYESNLDIPLTILQKVSLPLANSTECAAQLNPVLAINSASPIQAHEVCAGDTQGTYVNACHGDSGVPLVWFDGTSWQLIGIASRSVPGCPSYANYAVYVSIAAIREWITSHLPSNNAYPDASCACLHPATRHLPNGTTTLQYASWDGANCYLGPARQGCGQQPPENKAFISQNRYYLTPSRAIECPQGATGRSFTWDSCNCFFMNIPAGSSDFIFQNGYYVTAAGRTCPVIGSWDGANCFVEAAPWGTTAFKKGGSWYSTARPSCNSPFSYDGANCLFQAIPSGGFIYGNCFYRPTTSPGVCPAGSSFDGANCLVRCAPVATTAFSFSGHWYHTLQKQCDSGLFDSQNCLYMTPPKDSFAFEYSQNWYYGW